MKEQIEKQTTDTTNESEEISAETLNQLSNNKGDDDDE